MTLIFVQLIGLWIVNSLHGAPLMPSVYSKETNYTLFSPYVIQYFYSCLYALGH